jgi:hypothetical protein
LTSSRRGGASEKHGGLPAQVISEHPNGHRSRIALDNGSNQLKVALLLVISLTMYTPYTF